MPLTGMRGSWLAPPVDPWRVILTAIVPLWIYLTLSNLTFYESYILEGMTRSQIAHPAARVVQHLLLLPWAFACFWLSWRIGLPERRRVPALLGQVAIAFAFACAARPALNLGLELTMPVWVDEFLRVGGEKARHELDTPMSLYDWMISTEGAWRRATTEFFFDYWFGMALIVGLRTFLALRDEKLSASRLREDWLKARLDALAGQLNPHFLFNSLNTVSSFVRVDPERAETILADLSQLLRTSLRERARPIVSVADELEFIERYLAIERTRFEDRLQADISTEAEVLNARLPSLLLQPLVENAIKHGVSRSRGPATLRVEIGRYDELLRIVVENTFRPQEGAATPGESVGLRNVRERLETLYPARHTFTSGAIGERWRVDIRLPVEQDAEVKG